MDASTQTSLVLITRVICSLTTSSIFRGNSFREVFSIHPVQLEEEIWEFGTLRKRYDSYVALQNLSMLKLFSQDDYYHIVAHCKSHSRVYQSILIKAKVLHTLNTM